MTARRRRHGLARLVAWAASAVTTLAAAQGVRATDHAQRFATTCAACHGAQGVSTLAGTPSLAGQPSFYATTQLVLFREGRCDSGPLAAPAKGMNDADLRGYSALIGRPLPATATALSAAAAPPTPDARRCAGPTPALPGLPWQRGRGRQAGAATGRPARGLAADGVARLSFRYPGAAGGGTLPQLFNQSHDEGTEQARRHPHQLAADQRAGRHTATAAGETCEKVHVRPEAEYPRGLKAAEHVDDEWNKTPRPCQRRDANRKQLLDEAGALVKQNARCAEVAVATAA